MPQQFSSWTKPHLYIPGPCEFFNLYNMKMPCGVIFCTDKTKSQMFLPVRVTELTLHPTATGSKAASSAVLPKPMSLHLAIIGCAIMIKPLKNKLKVSLPLHLTEQRMLEALVACRISDVQSTWKASKRYTWPEFSPVYKH